MVKPKKELRILTPVGDVPSVDIELHRRIKDLHNEPLSEIFREVGDWEKIAVAKFKEKEQTKKSGRLTIQVR